MAILDLVILTIIPEEYQAICNLIKNLKPVNGYEADPNLYAWRTGSIECGATNSYYTVAVGMIGRAGTTKSALAALEAVDRWQPRYLFYVGIAGGFGALNKGDVVIADTIYGYEYGKIEKLFILRHNWTFTTDQALLNGATAYSLVHDWNSFKLPPPLLPSNPKIVVGEIASGDKVVDDPSNEFFGQVLKAFPKVKAVEMEGAGAGEAIDLAHAKGKTIGFMMIRGISDLPRHSEENEILEGQISLNQPIRGTQERDNWKPYASATAATFLISWVQKGLPVLPISGDTGVKTPGSSYISSTTLQEWSLARKRVVIDALLSCPSMNNPNTRADILNELPAFIRNNIRRGDSNQADVTNIFNTCLNYADGLHRLVDAINFFENDSIPMQQLKQKLHDLGVF